MGADAFLHPGEFGMAWQMTESEAVAAARGILWRIDLDGAHIDSFPAPAASGLLCLRIV